jgi:undecaprenyl pyrophosphate phosphatase UppP
LADEPFVWFMAYVRKHGFVPLAIYRIIVGILVLFLMSRLQ